MQRGEPSFAIYNFFLVVKQLFPTPPPLSATLPLYSAFKSLFLVKKWQKVFHQL
jgi:hypothetical protein